MDFNTTGKIITDEGQEDDGSSLTYLIYHAIKEDIMFGRLESGEKLNIVKLSKQYNVSRTPAKNALELLRKDNLIAAEPGKQAVVKRPSAQEVTSIYLFRKQLEPVVAKLSVRYVPTKELNELKAQLEELKANPKMYRAQIEFDRRLHAMLWRYLDSPMVDALFNVINDYSARVQSFIIRTVNKNLAEAQENNDEHMDIINAMLARNGDEARKTVYFHLTRSCQRLLDFYGNDRSKSEKGKRPPETHA